MEDLVPLLIFVVIAVINFLKYVSEKGGKKKPGPEPAPGEQPRRQPSSIEEFFEDLATKFEPQPTELPDWPEDQERPDYMKEMEEFEAEPAAAFEAPKVPETAPAPPEPQSWSSIKQAEEATAERVTLDHTASLKSAMRAMPAMLSSSRSLRFPVTPMPGSRPGKIDYNLREDGALRRAIIANIIFNRPRAYDASFDNTISD